METSEKIKWAMDKLGICRDLLTFDPTTWETFDEMFLNQENRDLYDAIGLVIDYVRQLEREKEALLKESKLGGGCITCKYKNTPMDEPPCGDCWRCNCWEWRGVEEEKHE